MIFQHFLIPLVSRYYYRARDFVTRIDWNAFGSTDAFHSLPFEPSDGEAVEQLS